MTRRPWSPTSASTTTRTPRNISRSCTIRRVRVLCHDSDAPRLAIDRLPFLATRATVHQPKRKYNRNRRIAEVSKVSSLKSQVSSLKFQVLKSKSHGSFDL